MIKIIKKWKPGFTSGMNLQQIGQHLSKSVYYGDITQPHWFMADGSSWDAH